jgi:uncharacterized protein YndB with AHSA1/START domain
MKRSIKFGSFLFVSHLFLSLPIAGEVISLTPSGFEVKREATVKAAPKVVFSALTERVSSWWNPQHTWSGDAKNLSIDLRPGGCFCETLPGGGGAVHMTVVNIAPPLLFRMTGALGPLQSSGVAGSLTWKLAATETGSALTLSYVVGGVMPGGLDRIGPLADVMLGEQVQRLVTFVETGKPVASP